MITDEVGLSLFLTSISLGSLASLLAYYTMLIAIQKYRRSNSDFCYIYFIVMKLFGLLLRVRPVYGSLKMFQGVKGQICFQLYNCECGCKLLEYGCNLLAVLEAEQNEELDSAFHDT